MVASYLFVPFALPALQNTIMLVLGLSVFAAAMAYDSSDRERISSRADCAFWLHLLAAPLIVHALVGLASYGSWRTTPTIAAAVVLIILGLAVVAVVIDRRALLVSGLSSLGVVIAYALTVLAGSPKPDRYAFAGTLLVLGALVLTLGLGWLALRRRLVPVLPAAITNHLPPVPQHQ
jgi:peptidoglycan/LPS O-acetylase OafA/YrhL